jgi:uncharacterized membrane protein
VSRTKWAWSKWERRSVVLLIVLACILYTIVSALFIRWAW